MKNVTLALKDELHHEARIAAAKAGKSLSQFVADALEERVQASSAKGDDLVKRQLEALERIFNGPKWDISENGEMPNAEVRNARR